MIPRFEEESNGITAHSMPMASPQPRGCGGAWAMRPEQAKQIIRHKGILTVEVETISLRESPTFLSTTEHWSP